MCQISVIVPVFNKKLFLRECIESVLHQSFQDFELILVDDGSTDGSEIMCDNFVALDARVTCIHQKNHGVGSARNVGILNATGNYIIFLDADDYLRDDSFSIISSIIQCNNPDLIVFGFYYITPNERRTITCEITASMYSAKAFSSIFFQLLHNNIVNNIGTKAYKRAIIDHLRFSEEFSICEDVSFCIDSLSYCKTVFFDPTPLYYYRQNVCGSLMAQYKENFIDAENMFLEKLRKYGSNVGADANFSRNIGDLTLSAVIAVLQNEQTLGKKQFLAMCYKICSDVGVMQAIAELDVEGKKKKVFLFLFKHRLYGSIFYILRFWNWSVRKK